MQARRYAWSLQSLESACLLSATHGAAACSHRLHPKPRPAQGAPNAAARSPTCREACSRYDGDSDLSEDDYELEADASVAYSADGAGHLAPGTVSRAAVWIAAQAGPSERPPSPGSPRDSIISEAISVKTVKDASGRLEHGAVVCLVSKDGELMGTSEADRHTWRLMPVAFLEGTAGGKHLQHFPTASVFVVSVQVRPCPASACATHCAACLPHAPRRAGASPSLASCTCSVRPALVCLSRRMPAGLLGEHRTRVLSLHTHAFNT